MHGGPDRAGLRDGNGAVIRFCRSSDNWLTSIGLPATHLNVAALQEIHYA